jgi:Zn-dependent protease
VPPLPPLYQLLAIALTIFLAIGIHEYCHAKFADLAGDPTPRYFGRVTLNLTKHFELMGTIMIIVTSIAGVGIGWGKPVPMDPSKMRNPKWDHFVAVAAGPASNFIQACIFALMIRAGVAMSPEFADVVLTFMGRREAIDIVGVYGFPLAFFGAFCLMGVSINIALCLLICCRSARSMGCGCSGPLCLRLPGSIGRGSICLSGASCSWSSSCLDSYRT